MIVYGITIGCQAFGGITTQVLVGGHEGDTPVTMFDQMAKRLEDALAIGGPYRGIARLRIREH